MKKTNTKELKTVANTINKKLKGSKIALVNLYRMTGKYGGELYNRSNKKRIRLNDIERAISDSGYLNNLLLKVA